MIRTLTATLAAGAVFAMGCDPVTPTATPTAQASTTKPAKAKPHTKPRLVLPPCPSEDSGRSCIWTGGRNHKGRWFVVDRRGRVWVLPSHRTQKWGTVDGHPRCVGFIGGTTVLVCADGWVTTS